MGGSKVLDNLQNVILVCAEYNGRMESDALIAGYARDNGHKASKFSAPGHPILDTTRSTWYTLDKAGNKTECVASFLPDLETCKKNFWNELDTRCYLIVESE